MLTASGPRGRNRLDGSWLNRGQSSSSTRTFRAQFRNLAPAMAHDGHKVFFITNGVAEPPGITKVRYDIDPKLVAPQDTMFMYAQKAARAMVYLKEQHGVVPDIIVGHVNWGRAHVRPRPVPRRADHRLLRVVSGPRPVRWFSRAYERRQRAVRPQGQEHTELRLGRRLHDRHHADLVAARHLPEGDRAQSSTSSTTGSTRSTSAARRPPRSSCRTGACSRTTTRSSPTWRAGSSPCGASAP